MRKSAGNLSRRLVVARKRTMPTTPFAERSPESVTGAYRLTGQRKIGSMRFGQSFNPLLLLRALTTTRRKLSRCGPTFTCARSRRPGLATGRNGPITGIPPPNRVAASNRLRCLSIDPKRTKPSAISSGRRSAIFQWRISCLSSNCFGTARGRKRWRSLWTYRNRRSAGAKRVLCDSFVAS